MKRKLTTCRKKIVVSLCSKLRGVNQNIPRGVCGFVRATELLASEWGGLIWNEMSASSSEMQGQAHEILGEFYECF